MIGISAFATGEEAVFAEEAFAAGNREGNHDAVAYFQRLVFGADLNNFAHIFMAQHVAVFHLRNDAAIDVQVRTADGASGDLDNGVARMLNLGVGNFLAADVTLAVPRQRFHINAPKCRRDQKQTY